MRFGVLSTLLVLAGPASVCQAILRVDSADPAFATLAENEIEAMRSGKRGLVPRTLIERLQAERATTTIHPLTSDESNWHPNDLKGTRSHTVARDTRVRGAERDTPTNADVYIHPSRVDPNLSLFKLGTFVHELAIAADLNDGRFSADYRTREKRASFYRNAWLDSMGLKPIAVSDRVPTPEYGKAKERGLLNEDNAPYFPLMDAAQAPTPTSQPAPSPDPSQ